MLEFVVSEFMLMNTHEWWTLIFQIRSIWHCFVELIWDLGALKVQKHDDTGKSTKWQRLMVTWMQKPQEHDEHEEDFGQQMKISTRLYLISDQVIFPLFFANSRPFWSLLLLSNAIESTWTPSFQIWIPLV